MTAWTRKLSDEGGFTTMMGMFWCVIFLIVGGLSVDAGNAWRTRAMLQATADAAAHAGAIQLAKSATDEAVVAEVQRIAQANLSVSSYGTVVPATNVEIGTWSGDGTFVLGSGGNAVRVTAERTAANSNAVNTYLLRLGILKSWDVSAVSVAQRFVPQCVTNGIVTLEDIEMSSQNAFSSNYCLHGETGVKLSTQNTFASGVTVSMPDLAMLQMPGGGYDKNPGLEEALREGEKIPPLVGQIPSILAGLQDPASKWQPDWINGTVNTMSSRSFNSGTLVPGTINIVECGNARGGVHQSPSNQQISFAAGDRIEQVVVVTNCRVTLSRNVEVANAIIATSSTHGNAISGSADTAIGRVDACTPGGAATLVAAGGIHFASKATFNDAQLITADGVHLAAQADGVTGLAIQAADTVKLTSKGGFALCETADEPALAVDGYRVVQ